MEAIYITHNYLEVYEENKDLMRYASSSSVRVKLLICLSEGIQTMAEIKKATGISGSTISNNLSNLEKRKITTKDGDKYVLSPLGTIITLNLIENIKTTASVNKFHQLWVDHEISSIPPELIKSIGDLENSTLIESESGEIFKPHEVYEKLVSESKYVKGVSPIFRSSYIDLFMKLIVKNDSRVELILTNDILKQTLAGIDAESLKDLKESISKEKVKLYVINEDVKVAFTVTDKHLSLGLFYQKGDYDNTRDLVSDDPDAVSWGNRLYEYYRNKSLIVEL
ncbi:MAG: winged helix-turn-helix domain-containing protein [Methanobacteriaceae archaeon]|nr:winged helix-turn-helix domain-containing protein [Methanobacteriaceae archaeon]